MLVLTRLLFVSTAVLQPYGSADSEVGGLGVYAVSLKACSPSSV